MVKNHLKNSTTRIRIRSFNKIKWIRHGHTLNLSTKFHPNLSPTFWDIVLYISLAPSLNGEESLKKFESSNPDPDRHQNLISSSLSHWTCPQNFIQIRPQLFLSCRNCTEQVQKRLSTSTTFLETFRSSSNPGLMPSTLAMWVNKNKQKTKLCSYSLFRVCRIIL